MGTASAGVSRSIPAFLALIAAFFIGFSGQSTASGAPQFFGFADDLGSIVGRSSPGDVIRLKAGRYAVSDLRIRHSLTIVGLGDVVLYSPGNVRKGLLVPASGVDLTVRNLTFEGAKSPDQNGAGIRFEGRNLRVENSIFRDNENGILATGDANGSVTVRQSSFLRNGHSSGYSHGIYQVRGTRLDIRDSMFTGTRGGHHIKTLAGRIDVISNSFDDANGRTSYVLDAPAGGRALFTENNVIRRSSSAQRNLVNYTTERGDQPGRIEITKNDITTEKSNMRVLRNPERLPSLVKDNKISGRNNGGRNEPEEETPATPAPAPNPTPDNPPASGDDDEPADEATPRPRPTVPEGEADMSLLLRRTERGTGYVTFGQIFEPGAIAADRGLTINVAGVAQPTQMDVKATHDDGSVRHAVVTLAMPSGNQDVEGTFVAGPVSGGGAMGWDASVFRGVTLRVEGQLGAGRVTTYTLDLGKALGNGDDWLEGPLAREKMAMLSAGPLLTVRADGRQYRDGNGRLRLTFENHKTFSARPRLLDYRVTLTKGNKTLLNQKVTDHYRSSGWTTVVPFGATEMAEAVPSLERLVRSGAIPPYEGASAVQIDNPNRKQGPVLPGTKAPVEPYMPATGGRRDIGPMTHWGAAWAITGDKKAREEMIRVAEVGVTVPWHFAEDATGEPVRVDERPAFWADTRGSGKGKDEFPAILFNGKTGGWTTDLAHKPQLAYPAYLTTGEAVFARELAHEGAYAVSGVWEKYRRNKALVTGQLQLREVAWSMRSLGNAAWLLPDNHPLKDYFVETRNENVRDLYRRYVRDGQLDAAGETEGWIDIFTPRGPGAHAPWQGDFLAMVMALETRRGTPRAAEVLDWQASYIAGRVLNIGQFNLYAGSRMTLLTRGGKPVSSWAQAERLTRQDFGNQDPYVSDASGTYAILRAALGAIESVSDDPAATRALNSLRKANDAEKLYREQNRRGRLWNAQFNLDTEK